MYSRYVSYSPPCIAIRIVFVTWCIRSSPNCNTYAFSEMCSACIRNKWYFQAALAGARYNQDCGPNGARLSQYHGTDQDGVEHRASEGRVRNSQAAIYAGADGCLYTQFGDSVTALDSRRGSLSQHEYSSPRYEAR